MLKLNVNTARGIVNTLVANGYLEHNGEQNDYSLGLIYLSKADLVNNTQMESIRTFARPYLDEIAQKYEASARLQLVSNNNIFTVETVNPDNSHYIIFTKMYQAFPLYATASGKLFLHYLPEGQRRAVIDRLDLKSFTPKTIVDKKVLWAEMENIAKRGYSTEDEEIGRGVCGIAVPILIFKGNLFGTISVTAFSSIINNLPGEAIGDMYKAAETVAKKVDPVGAPPPGDLT
jgi:DNA-binding IclR family transcriptional regulator